MRSRIPSLPSRTSRWYLLAALILLVAFFAYRYNLGGWLINDDEGSYLYQAWRISLGEMPYRDFFTPQLPAFLYPGALAMRLVGPSAVALRTFSVVMVILTAAFVYVTARRLVRPELALAAVVIFLLYPDLYAEGRVYRPEPFQLFFDSVAVYAFLRGYQENRRGWLIVSGVVFGLAMLSKLFGVLPLAGCGLFLLYLAARRTISWRHFFTDALAVGAPFVVVVGGVMAGFYLVTPNVFDDVLIHHLRQGSQLTGLEVVRKGLEFYRLYFQNYAPLVIFALPAAWQVLRTRDDESSFLVWQIPTALIFLFLSRELWTRHLLYLAPALAILMVQGLERLLTWPKRSFLPWAIMGAVIVPWYFGNNIVAHYTEDGTWRIADFIASQTAPDEYVLADYSELNFYARRPTGHAAAGLSAGAAASGQITGEMLIHEIEAHNTPLILMDTSEYGQLYFLRDRPTFLDYVHSHFHQVGTILRHNQEYAVYWTNGSRPFPSGHNFGDKVRLLSADVMTGEVPSGGQATVRAIWQAEDILDQEYVAFLHLVDDEGRRWGQGDAPLTATRKRFTPEWQPQEITADRFQVRVRPGTPPGTYHLRIGVYRRQDQTRLDLLNPDGNPAGTFYTVGDVQVVRPAQPLKAGAVTLQHPSEARIDNRVRLLGYSLSSERLQAGDTLQVALGWQALRAPAGDESIRLALEQADGTVAGEATFPPGTVTFPTGQWRQGEVVLGQYDLLVDAAAPAGDYTLAVTWLDAGGQPAGQSIPLASVAVEALERQFEVPTIPHSVDAQVGDRINLLGYDIAESQVAPGGVIHLILYWQARGRLSKSYKVFTHVVGDAERIWGQQDSIPVAGGRPTTSWLPGEVLVDEYDIPVKPETPAGRYTIFVGLYDPATNDRLPVSVEGQPAPNGRIPVTTVEVGE